MTTRGIKKPELPREEWEWFGAIAVTPGFHWVGATRVIDNPRDATFNVLWDEDSIVINA